jgi:hypothetical protein
MESHSQISLQAAILGSGKMPWLFIDCHGDHISQQARATSGFIFWAACLEDALISLLFPDNLFMGGDLYFRSEAVSCRFPQS